MTKKNKCLHFHMVAAEIMFRVDGMEEGAISRLNVNGILRTEDKNLRHRELGMAQMIVQQSLANKLKDESLQIADVFLSNIVYLGYMTDAQFDTPPPALDIPDAPADIIPPVLQ